MVPDGRTPHDGPDGPSHRPRRNAASLCLASLPPGAGGSELSPTAPSSHPPAARGGSQTPNPDPGDPQTPPQGGSSGHQSARVCFHHSPTAIPDVPHHLTAAGASPAPLPWAPRSPADLAGGLVEPGGDAALPVLVEVRLQDHAIAAGRHGGCGLRTRTGLGCDPAPSTGTKPLRGIPRVLPRSPRAPRAPPGAVPAGWRRMEPDAAPRRSHSPPACEDGRPEKGEAAAVRAGSAEAAPGRWRRRKGLRAASACPHSRWRRLKGPRTPKQGAWDQGSGGLKRGRRGSAGHGQPCCSKPGPVRPKGAFPQLCLSEPCCKNPV